MSKLEDLVPPLELCKRIPDGEFEDSCFLRFGNKPYIIIERRLIRKDAGRKDNVFPAPTLHEIIHELCHINGGFELSNYYGEIKRYMCVIDFVNSEVDENPATAALKCWLKLKGIKDGK